jgi:hypothetical protein
MKLQSEWSIVGKHNVNMRTERPLGAMEKIFYLVNQHHSNHFAMVGEVAGPTRIELWQNGLDQVARHSTLVWSRIEQNSDGVPAFRQAPQGSIPLKVLAYDASGWTTEVAAHLTEPFDESRPPLLRATLLHSADRSIIILVAHHSIADGLSLTFLLGDLLRAVSGQELVRSQETEALERLVERKHGMMPTAAHPASETPAAKRQPKEFRCPDGSAPHVEALRLTVDTTRTLRDRARAEGTTVQATLSAALTAATALLAPELCKEPLRIASPFDLRRRLLDHSDHLALCASAVVLSDDGRRDADLWARARHLGLGFAAISSTDELATMVLGVDSMLANVNAPADAKAVLSDVFGCEALLTNLGVVKLPREYGPLVLEAVWGPAVTLGFVGEQVVGAATFGDQLHLLHTSYAPIKGLLDQISVEITAALTKVR